MQGVFAPDSEADVLWRAAVFRNRRFAAQIFGTLFAAGSFGQVMLMLSIGKQQPGMAWLFVLPAAVVLLSCFEWVESRRLHVLAESVQGAREDRPVPALTIWFPAILESLIPIAGIALLGSVLGWEMALGSPPLVAAVALPFISVLRLDYRICVLQSAVAAVGFMTLVMLDVWLGGLGEELTTAEMSMQLGKAVLLVLTGTIAGLIARQNRRRLQEVIHERVERETVQESLRVRTAEYQRAADSLLGKNELISILSHDLRAPLDGVTSLAELMARSPAQFTADDVRKYAEEIGGTARDLRELLDNLVVWAELKAAQRVPQWDLIPLAEVVDAIARLFEPATTAKRLTVSLQVPADTVVFGDAAAVATVVRNLLSNAVKFTPPEGQITLSVDDAKSPDQIGLAVTDTGPGLAATRAAWSVRDPAGGGTPSSATIERGRPELGLALCRQLLGQMGGALELKSGRQGGAEAWAWFAAGASADRPDQDGN